MSDRDHALTAILADIRTWTIGPGGVSADGDEDTNNLKRVLDAHPQLIQAFARQPDPEFEARKQAMQDLINSFAPGPATSAASASSTITSANRPPNPLRMSQAIIQYRAAGEAEEIAPKTIFERERLLKRLSAHVGATASGGVQDPFVHEICTHHLSSLVDSMATKAATDGSSTEEKAAPRTLMKKISTLRSFFEWARDQLDATLTDPTAGLAKRDKALRKAATNRQENYHPFNTEQLRIIFSPRAYLASNNQADHFWAPLLGLHLGTRLKEIVTLKLENLSQDQATGIWYLDVEAEVAKNANSVRRLPITKPLVDLGFLEYVKRLRKLGATQLFPHRDHTSPTFQLDPSKRCSDRFGKYLTEVNIAHPLLVFHSFRHTVVSALADKNVPLSDSMQITGHQAQDHAVRSGRLSAKDAQSVHMNTYTHADLARLGVKYPLANLKDHLERAIDVPLDYTRLRLAADIVSKHVVRTPDGTFKSGWRANKTTYAQSQLDRLAVRA